MKIDPSHIDKLYGALAADNAAQAPREESRQRAIDKDSLALSDAARGHSQIDAAVKQTVDEATKPASAERLLRYKNAIQSGTYRVSSEDIAAAMIDARSGGDDS
jgi:anti-sigma28 factor (negative regulator of flagellin synthesis)